MSNHPLFPVLQEACKGMTYPSEIDADIEPFVWDESLPITVARLLRMVDRDENTLVEIQSVRDFLAGADFTYLAELLEERLAGVSVFKVGSGACKTAYVIGMTDNGQWAGVITDLIESLAQSRQAAKHLVS